MSRGRAKSAMVQAVVLCEGVSDRTRVSADILQLLIIGLKKLERFYVAAILHQQISEVHPSGFIMLLNLLTKLGHHRKPIALLKLAHLGASRLLAVFYHSRLDVF